MLFLIVLPSLGVFCMCAAFFPACIHTCYLVSKYTAEFINLFEALRYSRKGLLIFFSFD